MTNFIFLATIQIIKSYVLLNMSIMDITFTFKHKNAGERTYKTQAFVILLGNL